MKNFFKKYQTHFLVVVTSILIILTLYLIKGIYPFGNMTIANGDMGQSYIPFYVFLHDIVYEGKNLFYNYTLGMGSNIYGGFVLDGLFNPTSYLVLLNTRENVPYMLSFVLIAKIAFISLTSYILFNSIYKKNKFYNFLFSILYSFSGYVLTYNANIMWLDVVGLFPLFILSIKYMFEKNKIHWYSIVLALMLLYNYNLAYMIGLFIILIIPIYIFLAIPKDKQKQAILNLIIATILGIFLSSFAILPSFYQVITSYRMSNAIQNTSSNVFFLHKMAIILFYSLPIYGLGKWFWKTNEDKQTKKIYVIALIMTAIIPILFEKVNLLWHSGSYQLFPYRYGFIPILILSLGALKYFSNNKIKDNKKNNKVVKLILISIFIGALIIGINNAIYLNGHIPAFTMNTKVCFGIELVCIMMISILFIISITERAQTQKVITVILVISEILIYSYAYIGVSPERIINRELSDQGVFQAYTIEKEFNIEDTMYRLKDLTALTNENGSLIHNIPNIATFLHIISDEQVLNMEQLGYSHNGSKIHNNGGTIFSDAVYGVKYILTDKLLPGELYNYLDTIDHKINLYEYKNNLPIGLTYNNEVQDIPEDLNVFESQNYLYQNMFNKQEDIIKIYQEKGTNPKYNRFTLEVKECSQVYFYSKSEISQIFVNGNSVIMPVPPNPRNLTYGNYYNGILDLGTYKNQTVTIDLFTEKIPKNILIGVLDIEKYNQIFEEYKSDINITVQNDTIKITGNSDEDTNLFIPINYDKGWSLSNHSNQQTEIKRVYNSFIGLEIEKGEVDIELKFRPALYKIGVIISLISFILLFIVSYIKTKIEKSKILLNIAYYSFLAVSLLFFIKIYVIGIIENFIN